MNLWLELLVFSAAVSERGWRCDCTQSSGFFTGGRNRNRVFHLFISWVTDPSLLSDWAVPPSVAL